MAFNPFASFRKHQKYWMAGAVLVCMVTFVLCSGGMKGTGLDDVIMQVFRKKGNEYVRINGRGYTYEDITKLKEQRAIANDFMRATTKFAMDEIDPHYKELLKDPKTTSKDKDDQQVRQHKLMLELFQTCLGDLYKKYSSSPRFFRGGTRLDDLVEFLYWRDLADKYNVQISDAMARDLVNHAVHAPLWHFDQQKAQYIERQLMSTHYNATTETILRAVKEEFRVQIVQLAVLGRWQSGKGMIRDEFIDQLPKLNYPALYLNTPMEIRVSPTPEQINAHYKKVRTELTIDLLPISLDELAKKVELPGDMAKWLANAAGEDSDLTPEEKTARLKVLEEFYNKFAKQDYDPTSETPGFMMPRTSEIRFINAYPEMPYYKQTATAVATLRKTPLPVFGPLTPLPDAVGWLAHGPADQALLQNDLEAGKESNKSYRDAWEGWYRTLTIFHKKANEELPGTAKTEDKVQHSESKKEYQKLYDQFLNKPPEYKYALANWLAPRYWETPGFWAAVKDAKATPAAAHDLMAMLARPDGAFAAGPAYAAVHYQAQVDKLKPVIAADRDRRAQVGSQLLLSSLSGQPFTTTGMAYYAGVKEQVMPVAGYVEAELRTKLEERLAQEWVKSIMLEAKRTLEGTKGKKEPFEEALAKLRARYSRDVVIEKDGKKTVEKVYAFEEGGSSPRNPPNQYDVELDAGLKPLREAFEKYRMHVNMIEGRQGKADFLRESDFYKLFFVNDPVGANQFEAYTPRPWPPYVNVPKDRVDPLLPEKSREQRLYDDAQRPYLFWITANKAAKQLKFERGFQPTVDFIEKQYRYFKARAQVMDEVKKIARAVADKHKVEGDVLSFMRDKAREHGTEVISLEHVSVLVPNKKILPNDNAAYVEYTLTRDKFLYPRGDMVKQLLALNHLKAPLVVEPTAKEKDKNISYQELNELNTSLFQKNYKQGKLGQLQVLTNKPRTVYYIALVADVQEPPPLGFFGDSMPSLGGDPHRNEFAERVQHEMGEELLKLTVEAMKSADDKFFISDDARKQFDEAPAVVSQ
jgi:hypothetical protein